MCCTRLAGNTGHKLCGVKQRAPPIFGRAPSRWALAHILVFSISCSLPILVVVLLFEQNTACASYCFVQTVCNLCYCAEFFDNRLDVCLHATAGCQTGCTTRLTTTGCIVYTVWQLLWQSCWMNSHCSFNRFDNRLYRVNGVKQLLQLLFTFTCGFVRTWP